jgi:uncharacterized protein (TIGR03083 family)
MGIDYVAVMEGEAARIVGAYGANPGGKVPWSDRWSVNTVARHVAGSHHVVAQIIEDRPTADFGRFEGLDMPAKGDPGFPGWFAAGTEALAAQCRVAPGAEACWTPHAAAGGTVGFWVRHMANETLVHRWDAEVGAGIAGPAMDPVVAADALDEFLDVAVAATRGFHGSPAGPAVRVACTDTDAEWHLDLAEAGRRTLHRGPGDVGVDADVALTLRGGAEALLLWAYGRLDVAAAGVAVEGDHEVLAGWTELVPSG